MHLAGMRFRRGPDSENQPSKRCWRRGKLFDGLLGGCIRVNGEMVAYTVGELLEEDTLVIHFEKGNTDCKGIYQATNQMFENTVAAHPAIHYVNREQDLGDGACGGPRNPISPLDF
ncbi:MAG: phosphatidylglycerol lysyltransferase domain-containing protein [Desulfobacterales bacterium]